MKYTDAIISILINDEDKRSMYLKAILENERSAHEESYIFDFYHDDDCRSIIEAEWLKFSVMIIPAIETTMNIAENIMDIVARRISRIILEQNTYMRIDAKMKISIPFSHMKRMWIW